jgi:pheromone shutdown protein TraB
VAAAGKPGGKRAKPQSAPPRGPAAAWVPAPVPPPAKPPAASAAPAAPVLPPGPPQPPGQLTLIGTGHVFQVKDTIRQAIQALRPDLVCVELDRGRLQALVQRQQAGKDPAAAAALAGQQGKAGLVQRRLQRFQEGVASLYGADVGEEMLAAVQASQEVGARLALIDPPAEDTVRRVLKELTWRERLRAAGLVAWGTLTAPFRRGPGSKASIEAEIRRYQEDPAAALEELRVKFPTLHRIVIAERDALMARRIAKMLPGTRHCVAVVGDGHVPGLVAFLSDFHPTVYRLADVRHGRLPRPPGSLAVGTTEKVGYSFDLRM